MIGNQKLRRQVLHSPGLPCCCPTYADLASTATMTNHVRVSCRWQWWQDRVGACGPFVLTRFDHGVYRDVPITRNDRINCRFLLLDYLADHELDLLEQFFDAGGRALVLISGGIYEYRNHFNENARSIGMPEFWGEASVHGYLRTEVAPGIYNAFAASSMYLGQSTLLQDIDCVFFASAHEISGGTPLVLAPSDEMWGDVAGKPILSVARVGNGFAMAADYTAFAAYWGPAWTFPSPQQLLVYPPPGNSPLIRNFISAPDDEIVT